ncbi:MAG: hypothetical protein WBO17_07390 [Sphingorhabdus sp.]
MQLKKKAFFSEEDASKLDTAPVPVVEKSARALAALSEAQTYFAPVDSPALALQQQLVKRMANGEDGSVLRKAEYILAAPDKFSVPVSISIILGASCILWGSIIGAMVAIF